MSNPTVACILLTKDRPEMLTRAMASFNSQTYESKTLVLVNNGERLPFPAFPFCFSAPEGKSIGWLRNFAVEKTGCDIVAHFDDDEWSHPNRLTEQVALLQASGADLVGYNECLFWDTRWKNTTGPQGGVWLAKRDEAWLYRYPNPAYCLGSSFLYWRKTWERQPFDDVNHGEDERFRLKVKSVGVSAMLSPGQGPAVRVEIPRDRQDDPIITPVLDAPRMICAIHGGNTSHYAPERDRAMWRRAENWDSACERMMKL